MRQAALAVLIVLVVAGCGGGGSGSSRLSKSAFDSKANAICAKYQGKINGIQQPNDVKGIVAFIDRVLPLVEEGTAKLDELQPPQDIEAKVDDWRGVQHEQIDQAKKLKAAAENNDLASMKKIAEEADATNRHGNRLALQIGATKCAQD